MTMFSGYERCASAGRRSWKPHERLLIKGVSAAFREVFQRPQALPEGEDTDSLVCDPAHSHLAQDFGDGGHRLPQGVGTDRADTAYPECIDGCQLARV